MRLTCPNCAAQYELAEGVIPPEGRDVECSACNHVWFQRIRSPLRTPAPVAAPVAVSASPSPAAPRVAPAPSSIRFAAFEDEAPPAPRLPDFAPLPDEEDDAPAPLPPPRRSLNDSLLAVLREEAEREAAARRAEAQRFEFQPELGLTEPARPAAPPEVPPAAPRPGGQATSERAAEVDARAMSSTPSPASPQPAPPGVSETLHPADGAQLESAPQIAATPVPGDAVASFPPPGAHLARAGLPDPEAIGVTLNSTRPADPPRIPAAQAADTDVSAPAMVPPARGGFVWGMLLALLLAAAAGTIYLRAAQIGAQWPILQPALDQYVTAADGLRGRLDALAAQAGFVRR